MFLPTMEVAFGWYENHPYYRDCGRRERCYLLIGFTQNPLFMSVRSEKVKDVPIVKNSL
jgi:hypothetical protein